MRRIKKPPSEIYSIIRQMKWLSSAIKKQDNSSPGGRYCHEIHTSCRSELSNYMLCRLDKRLTARYIDGARRKGLISWVIVVMPKAKGLVSPNKLIGFPWSWSRLCWDVVVCRLPLVLVLPLLGCAMGSQFSIFWNR